MNRLDAFKVLSVYLKNPNLLRHSVATDEAMRALCARLNPQASQELVDTWGITGLLHDADYELTSQNPTQHGILISQKIDLPKEVSYAISSHNWQNTKIMPQSPLDWAIACCDQLTGLIVACALVLPEKKLSGVTPDFVMKKFYEKNFAKGADRNSIILCEEKLNIPLIEFVTIVLNSMNAVAPQLNL